MCGYRSRMERSTDTVASERPGVSSSGTARIDQAAHRCVAVLRHRPAGLFTDFDGTLSEIAPVPDAAIPYPGAREALARVAPLVDVAGIITGRAVDDVLARADVRDLPDLLVVGNHGLEWFDRGERVDHEAGLAAEAAIRTVMDRTESRMRALGPVDDMLFENKRLSASIHYRNVPDPVETGLQLLPIAEEEATRANLRVTAGKMLIELRPEAEVSKGTALGEIVRGRELRGAIFFGDDVTDVDGFRELHRLRNAGELETLTVGVRSADVHPDVVAFSDVLLDGVPEMVLLLARIGDLLEKGEAKA